MCMPCSTEYYAYLQSVIGAIQKDLTPDRQIEEVRKADVLTESHMVEFVKRRDGKP